MLSKRKLHKMQSAQDRDAARTKDSQGFVLITAYLVLSAFLILNLGIFSYHVTHIRTAERMANKIIAFNVAEGALSQKLTELRTGNQSALSDIAFGHTSYSATF